MMARRLFPDESGNISMIYTPMIYTARLVKHTHPGSKVVFIGPCAAKKLEAMQQELRSDVDFVLTYEELMGIFEAKAIDFSQLPDTDDLHDASGLGRGFAAAGGVAAGVEEVLRRTQPDMEVKIQRADGLRECRRLLTLAKAGKFDGYLLEGMACPGRAASQARGRSFRRRRQRSSWTRMRSRRLFSRVPKARTGHLPGCWKNRRHAKKKRNDERSSLTRC